MRTELVRCRVIPAVVVLLIASSSAVASQGEDEASDQLPVVLAQQSYMADKNRVHYDVNMPNSVKCGPPNAKVTIAFFGGFQERQSALYYGTIATLRKEHPKDISVVMGQFYDSRHPDAEQAARLTLAARQHGKFCEMMDAIYETFTSAGGKTGVFTAARKQALTAKVGLDAATLDATASSQSTSAALEADREYAKSLGVRVVPTIFVNGRVLPKFEQSVLRSTVQEELNK